MKMIRMITTEAKMRKSFERIVWSSSTTMILSHCRCATTWIWITNIGPINV